MSVTLKYRQSVDDFRPRLEKLLRGRKEPARRVLIDTGGYNTRRLPYSNLEELVARYGEARHHSVARVMALFELARETENLHRRPHKVEARPAGAVWQAYKGNRTFNACHTCPSLLKLDGHLPTAITRNRGLQRHMIIVFADCMMIPRNVNDIDSCVDDLEGRKTFARAAEVVLNERGVEWREGVDLFRERMRSVLGYVSEVVGEGGLYQASDPEDRERLNTFLAYYRGLYLHGPSDREIGNYKREVSAEADL